MADVFDFYVYDNRSIVHTSPEPIMQEDKDVAVWRFRIPKVLNNIDMSAWSWWFVYVNAKNQKFSELLSLNDDIDDPENFSTADYSIGYGISKTPGGFTFALEAINAEQGGEISGEWHTRTYAHTVTPTLQGNQAEYAETESDVISALMQEVRNKVDQLVGGATPLPVNLKSQMTDHDKVYLYTGSEPNESTGYWYYWNGTNFVPGGVYGAGDPESVQGYVEDWLEDHPEATTTVQDGAITEAKLAEALILKTIKGYVTPQMYGAVGDGVTDDTVAIKSAMTSGADVFFPSGNYLVSFDGEGGFIFKFNANQTVVMSGDAYIRVKANSYTHYRVMSFDANSTGAKLFGGNIVGDKDTHTYTSGSTHEYCHAISVSDSANVIIKDVNISDMPGDGVSIGGSGENKNASNITVNSVTIDHCRRQGISICGGKNVIITDCRISNIGGTPPQSGIDIEPWANGQVSEGIVISNCIIESCQGRGVLLASSIDSPIVQATICNMVMKSLSRGCIEITDGTGEGSAVVGTGSEGVVNISNIIADGLGFPAVLVVNHPNTSYRVNVDNIVAKNINTGSNGNDYNAVISVITNNSYSAGVPVGNVYVKNVTPISGNYRRYLWMIASQTIKNVTIDLPGYIYTGMKNAGNPQNELLVNSDAEDVVFNDPYHVSVYEYGTYYKATIPINRWYSRRIVTEDVTQDYTFSFNNDDDAFFEFDVEIINMNPNHNVIINADFVNHTGALTLGYCERATVKRLKSVRKELLVSTTAIFNNS